MSNSQTAPAAPAHVEEWANPSPAGLIALAIACFCFFGILSGHVERSATPYLACWLLGGFIVQFTVAIIELREKNLTGGNVFLFFSAFFMFTGGIKYLVGAIWAALKWPEIDHHIDGWAWLVLALTLLLWTGAYLKRSGMVMGLLILLLDVGVSIVALRDLGVVAGATWNSIAGWFLLGAGICGIYVASAMILNAAYGKTMLPMPGPILK